MSTMSTSGSPTEAQGPIALAGAPRPAGAPKPKPRKRVNTAEKRHQHNAIERQRRETLNSKFLVLARLLPSLASCRRPSKSAIVNGSISHLSHQRQQRLLASKLLRQLAQERDELFAEVAQWRQANGCAPKAGPASSWTDEMEEVCQVEKETFGSFASVDDNNNNDEDEDEDEPSASGLMNIEKAAMVAGNLSTGLITPRSSTDMGSSLSSNSFMDKHEWSADFSVAPSVPFNAFMGEVDSSSNSPTNSSHQSAVLTPPMVDTAAVYTHTPSPRSSVDAHSPTAATPQQWTPQQLAFFQAQVQQQQMRAHMLSAPSDPLGSLFMPNSNNGLAHLMAAMFPQQSDMNDQQAEQWRKVALNGLLAQQQPTAGAAADSLKLGGLGSLAFGLGNWSEQAVGV